MTQQNDFENDSKNLKNNEKNFNYLFNKNSKQFIDENENIIFKDDKNIESNFLYNNNQEHVSKFTQKHEKIPSVRIALPLMRELLQNETNVVLICAFNETSSVSDINWIKDNQTIVIDGLEKKLTVKFFKINKKKFSI